MLSPSSCRYMNSSIALLGSWFMHIKLFIMMCHQSSSFDRFFPFCFIPTQRWSKRVQYTIYYLPYIMLQLNFINNRHGLFQKYENMAVCFEKEEKTRNETKRKTKPMHDARSISNERQTTTNKHNETLRSTKKNLIQDTTRVVGLLFKTNSTT